MARIELRNLSKHFGDTRVLCNISFAVEDGEFVVLVGPSGCGKSTILRSIAGLEMPSEGEIVIGERVVNNVPPRDRDIAMVFQNYALYPHFSVFDNMAFGLKMRKVPKEEIRTRVDEAAEVLRLTDLLSRKPRQLSGGQRQRVALGWALVRKPQAFLFDEPLSNLDAKLRTHTRAELSRLHKQLGVTMVYVTHDQVEAMTLGQRIVVLKDGRVQQVDTPLNVYRCPANRFVGGFIGSPSMNFVTGEQRGDEFVHGNLRFVLPQRIRNSTRKKPLTLGLRPEQMRVGEPAGGVSVEIVVELVEPLGNEMLVYGRWNDERLVIRTDPGVQVAADARVSVAFDPETAHYFDGESDAAVG